MSLPPCLTHPYVVYRYNDAEGEPLYVGQSSNVYGRDAWHRSAAPWFADAVGGYEIVSRHKTRGAALAAEAEAIGTLRPRENIFHNPDRRRRSVRGAA